MNTNGHNAQYTSTPQGGFEAANELRDRLIAICGRLETAGRRLSDPGASDTAAKLAQRTADDAFRVMVIGDFKRGKSTFVNALLGAQVLPVKATPATAVITEVRYGDTPAARLWPADPALPGEDVSPEELTARIIIDNQDPDKPSPFRLAEVFWPLELCRNNVVLIDSPGLNEHVRRDEITLKELRDADAVIFLQH
jgi:ribosome biogenesis GTPase A